MGRVLGAQHTCHHERFAPGRKTAAVAAYFVNSYFWGARRCPGRHPYYGRAGTCLANWVGAGDPKSTSAVAMWLARASTSASAFRICAPSRFASSTNTGNSANWVTSMALAMQKVVSLGQGRAAASSRTRCEAGEESTAISTFMAISDFTSRWEKYFLGVPYKVSVTRFTWGGGDAAHRSGWQGSRKNPGHGLQTELRRIAMSTVPVIQRIILKNVLFLTDFSEPSTAALPFAAMIAR